MAPTSKKLENPLGLTIEFLESGAIRSIECKGIRVSLKNGTLHSFPGSMIFLRRRNGEVRFTPLFGPGSESRSGFAAGRFISEGTWENIRFSCILELAGDRCSWKWSIRLRQEGGEAGEYDLVYLQDLGLKTKSEGPVNEYYVSQYLERRILDDPRYGAVICCRQNMKEGGGNPWLMISAVSGGQAGSTDGLQFFGRNFRYTGVPEGLNTLEAGGECAGESSVVALQTRPFVMNPGSAYDDGFVVDFVPDHPGPTSEKDLGMLSPDEGFKNSAIDIEESGVIPLQPSFSLTSLPLFPSERLTSSELIQYFGEGRRHCETENGRILSFFTGQGNHIVLLDKELITDRPHGHIMQTGSGFAPDDGIMSTTVYMYGVFNSHITQGNTNFNVLLSICTGAFNQSRDDGQRIAVSFGGDSFFLGVPSAFEMGLNHCRWIYKFGDRVFQVRTWTSRLAPQINLDFKVLNGAPVDVQVIHGFDPLNRWSILQGASNREFNAVPDNNSMITGKYPGAGFRFMVQEDILPGGTDSPGQGTESLFIIPFFKIRSFCLSILGEVNKPADPILISDPDLQWLADVKVALGEYADLTLGLEMEDLNSDADAIREILPWYGMNALIHYLTPYGLEQFGGAAWGTRDVAQGPVELLLTLEKYEEARKVLLLIFSNQNPDGGWPQWWMFDRYREIRAHEAHGDIFYWCMLALCNYVKITGDNAILREKLPYFTSDGNTEPQKTTLREHLDRLINLITRSFIPGTSLVPYGGGDWNDSLQPVSQDLASRMISSWTVEMNYQAFRECALMLERSGDSAKANELKTISDRIRQDFNRYLVRDGIVAGYGLVEADGEISIMLHPTDRLTGISYSLLPMNRGIISGIFTREQALHHAEIIEKHLKGPDGARLMDRPLRYRGGIQEIFQRAESSTYFGREIGLMYIHEHIRYAEGLAKTGRPEAFVKALRQAIPVGYRDVVPCGAPRQSNCYYSSSDVTFASRYQADTDYEDVIGGKLPLKGGWRVYSSGPGIFIGIVVTRLLGLRLESGSVILDPVMPKNFDGFRAGIEILDHPVVLKYSVGNTGYSPLKILINNKEIEFNYEENPYRQGGAVMDREEFLGLLNPSDNLVEIFL